MPLPWKKTKVARISRLVADLHAPTKRGGSLVVQTGFPTSLVDLFVKNRDRLKKHHHPRNKSQQSQSQSQSQPQQQQTHSHIEISNPILNPSRNEINTATHVREFVVVEEEFDGDGNGGGGGGGSEERDSVLVAVLKMFVMVVIALSTKRLAVGVTMSAILLLLLEYVAVRGLFCSNSKTMTLLVSFLQKIKFKKVVASVKCINKSEICEEEEEESSLNSGACHELADDDDDIGHNSSSLEEIQVEEEIRIIDVLMTNKNDPGRGAKFKEKLVKRLVPKKLRGFKKKSKKKNHVEMESSSQVSGFLGENKLGRVLEQEQDNENESSIVLLEGKTDTGESVTVCHGEVDKVGIERQANCGYLILILMVLAGLVGGRIVALVFTLAWFFMLKFVGMSRPVSSFNFTLV